MAGAEPGPWNLYCWAREGWRLGPVAMEGCAFGCVLSGSLVIPEDFVYTERGTTLTKGHWRPNQETHFGDDKLGDLEEANLFFFKRVSENQELQPVERRHSQQQTSFKGSHKVLTGTRQQLPNLPTCGLLAWNTSSCFSLNGRVPVPLDTE